VRFTGLAYRAHDPRWAFTPLSGEGAALHGGRFNRKGIPALYLALDPITTLKEASQGFAHKFEPYVLCTYEVDCEPIVDARTEASRREAGVDLAEMDSSWFADAQGSREPASWALSRRLIGAGAAGLLAPSFAAAAAANDVNLVLWRWGPKLPTQVTVFDPSGRLPKNQLSWS
jgi:RES domain-containing protein